MFLELTNLDLKVISSVIRQMRCVVQTNPHLFSFVCTNFFFALATGCRFLLIRVDSCRKCFENRKKFFVGWEILGAKWIILENSYRQNVKIGLLSVQPKLDPLKSVSAQLPPQPYHAGRGRLLYACADSCRVERGWQVDSVSPEEGERLC